MNRKQCMIDKAKTNGRALLHAYATGLIRGIANGSYPTAEEKLLEIVSTLEDLDEVAYDDSLPWDAEKAAVSPVALGEIFNHKKINQFDPIINEERVANG